MTEVTLVLASASPSRLSVLRTASIEPTVIVSGVDEDGVHTTDPVAYVCELAQRKARAVVPKSPDGAIVLGCDSTLELDGAILGKPLEPEIAVRRWKAMRGRSGVLHTGHCVVYGGRELTKGAATTVHFADVTDAEIAAYVATGEPLQVAGAFTLEGRAGAFIERIEGDPHNVMGLSLPLLRVMVAELGVSWPDLWTTPG